MKRILITILALITLHTYAEDDAKETYPCVFQLSPEQKQELTSIGLDAIQVGASNKDPKSISQLGGLYLTGTLVEKDESKGLGYIKQAAELGRANSMKFLYAAYFCGLGTEVNEKEGIRWLEKYVESQVEVVNFEGKDYEYRGNKSYLENAYILLNKYYYSGKDEYKQKLINLTDDLINHTRTSVSSDRQMASNPESYRTVTGKDIAKEKIVEFYNSRADSEQKQLDKLLNFRSKIK